MRILRTTQALRIWRRGQKTHQSSIGFVPTMGSLHDGHRSLIERARKSCKTVVVSIFVNPLQFGPSEDFGRYPRDLSKDLTICRKANVDAIFIPQIEDLYSAGYQTIVTVEKLSHRWEGEHRPTHFQGVTTVVAKLLNLVCPSRTFFGQKDYQQFLMIQQMVKDLNLGTRLTLCPTVREPDGLAMSSRNRFLTTTQRQEALLLYQALQKGKQLISDGQRNGHRITKTMYKAFHHYSHITIDYLACCNAHTLEPANRLQSKIVLLGAIRLKNLRLIDNMVIQVRS